MAKTIGTPVVGMYVYKAYEPNNPGKIKKIISTGAITLGYTNCKVKIA